MSTNTQKQNASKFLQNSPAKHEASWIGYCWAAGSIAVATCVFLTMDRELDISHDVDLLYLPIVLGCANRFGMGPACLAATASVLCWDFFFLKPLYSFHVASARDSLMLLVFLIVTVLTGRLAERVHRKTREAATLEERNRMARELHDTLAQGLTGIVIQLQAAERVEAFDVQTERSAVRQARMLAEQCLEEARRSVRAIRPSRLEQRTLPEALRVLLEQMTHKLPIRTDVRVEGTVYVLPEIVEINLLRIGQEALTNALRHAKPNRVDMTVVFAPGSVCLRVRDDGDGFDIDRIGTEPDSDTFGLAGMRERAEQMRGTLTMHSRPKQGTDLEVVVPISRREPARQKHEL